MAQPIPDRWMDYKPVGEKVEGTRFIAFKVPLKHRILKTVANDIRLDDTILLKLIPNLGMIVDLTNTYRYYNPRVFEEKGIEYKKLMIPGHDVPTQDRVDKFIRIVKEFIKTNKDNNKLIGVHCTHGINRTGYLICNYMISQLAIKPTEAIKRFDSARGHEMERKNYIADLYKIRPTNGQTSYSKTRNWTERRYQTDQNPENWRIPKERRYQSDQNPENWRIPKQDYSNRRDLSNGSYKHSYRNNYRRDTRSPYSSHHSSNRRSESFTNRQLSHRVRNASPCEDQLRSSNSNQYRPPQLRSEYHNARPTERQFYNYVNKNL